LARPGRSADASHHPDQPSEQPFVEISLVLMNIASGISAVGEETVHAFS
jgi:hypothetical protein